MTLQKNPKDPKLLKVLKLIPLFLKKFNDSEVRLLAAALSFNTLVSIIPFLAIILALFKSLGGLDNYYPQIESTLIQYFTGPAGGEAIWAIKRSIHNVHAGSLGSASAILLMFVSVRLLGEIETAVNYVWSTKENRPFYKRFFLNWSVFLLIPLLLALYFGIITSKFPWGTLDKKVIKLLGFALSMGLIYLLNALFPVAKTNKKKTILCALLAGIILQILKSFFMVLMDRVFDYDKIYGSIAAIPILMLWILSIWYVILGSVALNAVLHERN